MTKTQEEILNGIIGMYNCCGEMAPSVSVYNQCNTELNLKYENNN